MRDLHSNDVETAAYLAADDCERPSRRRVRPWDGNPETAPDFPEPDDDTPVVVDEFAPPADVFDLYADESVDYDDADYYDCERGI